MALILHSPQNAMGARAGLAFNFLLNSNPTYGQSKNGTCERGHYCGHK